MTKKPVGDRLVHDKIVAWTCDRLPTEVTQQAKRLADLEDTFRVALMPDVHAGQQVPNGCVLATKSRIYPDAVGRDIGCGLSAICFDNPIDSIPQSILVGILDHMGRLVPSLKQPRGAVQPKLPEACSADQLVDPFLMREANRDGLLQLGTLGRGNHFIELELDEANRLWALVHSGSRSMGQKISDRYLREHQTEVESMSSNPIPSGDTMSYLDLECEMGQAYLSDMNWGIRYATENRMLMLNRVADLVEEHLGLAAVESSYIDSPHNFARIEEHHGERLIVHRKSANSAVDGELGIIPGSMAAGSRIVIGRGEAMSLRSSSHGAGRKMSRTQAWEKLQIKQFKSLMGSIVFRKDQADKFLDESPDAYRNLNEVMQSQRDLVSTRHILKTILNYKTY